MQRLLMIAGTALLALTVQASAEGDPAKGEKVFKKCAACHAVGPEAKNKVGPELNGIVGRAWGAVDGYKYSANLLELADGKVWDEETLDVYLTKPKDLIPKGKMAFAGLKKEDDRANVIAYLNQYNEDGSSK
ncbi:MULTISPECIES: c-type cytochrome [Stappiaceae]|jgi:cytochrome c|uniref:Cytochrome c class I n=2 Tax=Roseibium TaxID=150830 RepID=A0A0M6Y5A1_9HYPH|nr:MULTISPECIES: cytochrome c family protein [Stappiaceae]MCR9281585.1 cytochrome c family protein [Paracoccaceae bacterium]MEC9418958.1 cytochrome c family protein [Pseudomonadota bacterium]AMN54845.1 cytochrome C [Labrenzia sp. CP4]MBO9461313.1 cytochrome c family protein [Labrenzia sp. R5_0]MEC9468399.1 cytochrome c family protein [Pseudomonadota bacterium]